MQATNPTERLDTPMAEAASTPDLQRPYEHPASFFANQKPYFFENIKGKSRAKANPSQQPPQITKQEDYTAYPHHSIDFFSTADQSMYEEYTLPSPNLFTSMNHEEEMPAAPGHKSPFPNAYFRQIDQSSPPPLDFFYPAEPEPHPNYTLQPLTLSEAVNFKVPNVLPRFHARAPHARPWNCLAFQEVIRAWNWTNTIRYQAPNVLDLAEMHIYDSTPASWIGLENERAKIITAAVFLRIVKITWKCGYKGFTTNEKDDGFKVFFIKGDSRVRPLPAWMPLAQIEIVEGRSFDFMSPQQKMIAETAKEEGYPSYPIENTLRDWSGGRGGYVGF